MKYRIQFIGLLFFDNFYYGCRKNQRFAFGNFGKSSLLFDLVKKTNNLWNLQTCLS